MTFKDSIDRMTEALIEHKRAGRGRCAPVSVRADDLLALLEDHARLDDEARLIYRTHTERLRAACDEMEAALAQTLVRARQPERRETFLRRLHTGDVK